MQGAELRQNGLNHGQFALLLGIGAAEGLTQQELAYRLSLTKANVSQMLDKLEAAELVRRVPDARAYAHHLTERSRQLLGIVIPAQEQVIIEQFSGLSSEEQPEFRRLQRIAIELSDEPMVSAGPC
jgi:DNA-binding MarR family transcriptional regulator